MSSDRVAIRLSLQSYAAEQMTRDKGADGVPTIGAADDGVTSSGVMAKSVRGHCMMFTVHPYGDRGRDQWGGNLSSEEISERKFIDPSSDDRQWIECTSIQIYGKAGRRATCMFRRDRKDGWSLGVVECLKYLEAPALISLYEWDGDDIIFDATTWEEQEVHFRRVEFVLDEIDLHWVNQVNGSTPGGGKVPDETRCRIDGRIQCLEGGPDEYPFEIPAHYNTGTKPMGLNRFDINEENTSTYNAEYGNAYESRKGGRGRVSNRKKSVDESSAFVNSTKKKPPIRLVKGQEEGQEQDGLVVLLTRLDGKSLTVKEAKHIDAESRDKLWLPIPSTSGETALIESALITKKQLRAIERQSPLDRESFDAAKVKEVLGQDVDIVETLSTDYVEKILKDEGALDNYRGLIRIFVGDSAPSVSELEAMRFSSLDLANENIRIHFGVCAATEFKTMIPLSMSFFHSSVHKIKVPYLVPELVTKAVGGSGAFSYRTTTTNSGSCSFVGPRQSHQAQPSPSAGPSLVNDGHMYHRQGNDQRYTPFLYKLANFLGTTASKFGMGLHYLLFHVIRYVIDMPGTELGLCCLGIITINFCNSLHIDAGDDMKFQGLYEEVVEKLELLVKIKTDASFAQGCLDFLKWSKSVAVATTCVYQHIFEEERCDGENIEEIICYFPMLSSISLRLKPWLVHHFFASKISHCTSVPLFRIGDDIYVGKPPKGRRTAIFAWGESNSGNKPVSSRTRSKTNKRRKTS